MTFADYKARGNGRDNFPADSFQDYPLKSEWKFIKENFFHF